MNREGSDEEGEGEAQPDGEHQEGEPNGIVTSGEAPPGGPGKENKERMTTPYMTKYERARILGTRALQIRCERSMEVCLSPADRK